MDQKETSVETYLATPENALAAWVGNYGGAIDQSFVEQGKRIAEETAGRGDLEGALALLAKLKMATELLERPLFTAIIWRGQANIFQLYEQYDDSLAATAHAVSLLEQHGTPFDIAVARTSEVGVLGALARIDDAVALANWIRPHFGEADFTFGLATIAINLGKAHSIAWQIDDALREYTVARRLYEKADMPHMVGYLLHDMGLLASQNGDQAAAQAYLTEAYPLLVADENLPYQIKTQFNLAESLLHQGAFEKALAHLKIAREHLAQVPEFVDHGFVDLLEARVRSRLNQREAAEALLNSAYTHFNQTAHHVEAAEALIDLAHLISQSESQERLSESLTHLDEAETQLTAVNLPYFTAWIQLDKAELLFRLGRTSEAARLARLAQQRFAAGGLSFRQAYADVLLADCLSQQGEEADPLYARLLTEFGAQDPLLAVRCHTGLGKRALLDEGWQTAVFHFEQAVTQLDQIRRNLSTHATQSGFLENKQTVADGLLTALQQQTGGRKQLLGWVERFKARALADLLAQQPADPTLTPQLRALLKQREQLASTLDMHIAALHRQSQPVAATQRSAAVAAHDRFQMASMADLRKRVRQLEQQIAQHRSPTTDWRNGTALAPDELHNLLADDAMLIAFYEAAGQLNALTLTNQPDDVVQHSLGISLAEVEQQWRQTQRFLLRPKRPLSTVQPRLAQLWDGLIEPLLPRLQSKARLIVLPHRALFHLPFAAFYDGKNGRYLIDRWTLQLAPSATILGHCQQRTPSSQRALLLGYPSEPDRPDYLPSVQQEIETLAQLLPETAVFFDTEATRENLLNNLADQAIVHLAGHAIYNAQQPLESGMPLKNGRWLRASDLYLRHGVMDGATVVLSGCETGRGRLSGADVLGLTSAFLYAGASSVVSGLWKVDDSATAALMTHFYQQLTSGFAAADALRAAQQTLRNSAEYAAPFYWAPFTLTGASHKLFV